jgi:hypothetical protein
MLKLLFFFMFFPVIAAGAFLAAGAVMCWWVMWMLWLMLSLMGRLLLLPFSMLAGGQKRPS